MLVLYIMLTLLGLIIMLNVIIAVISDSYERAKIQSGVLFGRARVSFVAQNEALESFLRPGINPVQELTALTNPSSFLVVIVQILRWLVLISLIVTTMYAFVYIIGRSVVGISNGMAPFKLFLLFVFLVILTPALCVLFLFAVGSIIRTYCPERITGVYEKVDRNMNALVRSVGRRVMGLEDVTGTETWSGDDSNGAEEGDWQGRTSYAEKSFEKKVEQETEDIKSELYELEKRMYTRMHELMSGKDHED